MAKGTEPKPPALPSTITAALLERADDIARKMTRRIADDIPLRGEFRRVGYLRLIMASCQDALHTLLSSLHAGEPTRSADLERLGTRGAQQAELGVSLDVLLRAYRLAATVVWDEVISESERLDGLPPGTVVMVTRRVLEYLDEISAAVVRAYLETRERLHRQQDRDRDRILQRLLAGDTSDELRRTAAAAGMPLQPPYRVIACASSSDHAERFLDTAWRDAGALLVADEPGMWIALVPPTFSAPPTPENKHALVCAVSEPIALLADIPQAAKRTRAALLVGRQLYPQRTLHRVADMGIYAVLADDPAQLRRFADHVLGPLAADASPRTVSLLATLDALINTASTAEAAKELGLHRHTVVYRMHRLQEALGINLERPEHRHRAWLALSALRLLGDPRLPLQK